MRKRNYSTWEGAAEQVDCMCHSFISGKALGLPCLGLFLLRSPPHLGSVGTHCIHPYAPQYLRLPLSPYLSGGVKTGFSKGIYQRMELKHESFFTKQKGRDSDLNLPRKNGSSKVFLS